MNSLHFNTRTEENKKATDILRSLGLPGECVVTGNVNVYPKWCQVQAATLLSRAPQATGEQRRGNSFLRMKGHVRRSSGSSNWTCFVSNNRRSRIYGPEKEFEFEFQFLQLPFWETSLSFPASFPIEILSRGESITRGLE